MPDLPVPDDFIGARVVQATDECLVLEHQGHQFEVVPVVTAKGTPNLLDYVHLGSHS